MPSKCIKKKHEKLGTFPAKKEGGSNGPQISLAGNPPKNGVLTPTAPDGFSHLYPVCPAPGADFSALSKTQVRLLTDRIMARLKELQPHLDMGYWRRCAMEILSSDSPGIQVIPARAGAGKSTWIRAFLLTLCSLWQAADPLAGFFGGVLLILQKVEELNEIDQMIKDAFPQANPPLMVPLQSLTASGKESGRCVNPEVRDYQECPGEQCPSAGTCPLLHQQEAGRQAFLLGATQARFYGLRQSEQLDTLLLRKTEDGQLVRRRFVLFDEKPELFQIWALDQTQINRLSTRLERLPSDRSLSDLQVGRLQQKLHFTIEIPFQESRRSTVIQLPSGKTADQLVGFYYPQGTDPAEFEAIRTSLIRHLGQSNRELLTCLHVAEHLYRGSPCLFCKAGSFHLFFATDGTSALDNHQTLIFDATAEVDGDYCHQPRLRLLSPSPPREMSNVTFHVFSDSKLNVSKAAMMKKSWLPEALCTLIEALLTRFPGKTFLCTYKAYSTYFACSLSAQALKQIVLMPGQDPPCVPYFGGTNGSNRFRTCTNVILLGYPRLDPESYLERCYAAWKDAGFQEQLEQLCARMSMQDHPWKEGLRALPMMCAYEDRHLAARLEQEIYRCALRDRSCSANIHIFLFHPPSAMWDILKERFPGCQVDLQDTLPECILQAIEGKKSYRGKPTAQTKVRQFLETWDGSSISVPQLRTQLEISLSAWKELQRTGQLSLLLEHFEAERFGRGQNAQIRRLPPPNQLSVPA